MTTQEINEGNKIIAAFMGYEENDYYNDWNKLMAVVEKITTVTVNQFTPFVSITNYACTIEYERRKKVSETTMYGLIDAVYQTVVKFIRMYNKNRRTQ